MSAKEEFRAEVFKMIDRMIQSENDWRDGRTLTPHDQHSSNNTLYLLYSIRDAIGDIPVSE